MYLYLLEKYDMCDGSNKLQLMFALHLIYINIVLQFAKKHL